MIAHFPRIILLPLVLSVLSSFLPFQNPKQSQTLRSFELDAFLRRQKVRTISQEYVYTVYGGAGFSHKFLKVRMTISLLAYFFVALFLFLVSIRPFYNFSSLVMSIFLILTILILLSALGMSIFMRLRKGTIAERRRQFLQQYQKAIKCKVPTANLPFWWLYGGVNRYLAVLRSRTFYFSIGHSLALLSFLWCLSIVFAYCSGISYVSPIIADFFLTLWLTTGWVLPFDAIVSLAEWRGDGSFSEAVLHSDLDADSF